MFFILKPIFGTFKKANSLGSMPLLVGGSQELKQEYLGRLLAEPIQGMFSFYDVKDDYF